MVQVVILVLYLANRALLIILLFCYCVSISCLFTLCLFLLSSCTYCILINFRLQYEGTPKYLGESVTGSEFGIWK